MAFRFKVVDFVEIKLMLIEPLARWRDVPRRNVEEILLSVQNISGRSGKEQCKREGAKAFNEY
jgi:hypothetical protein